MTSADTPSPDSNKTVEPAVGLEPGGVTPADSTGVASVAVNVVNDGGAPAVDTVGNLSGALINWQDQDGILRDLWARNLPPPAIAEQLNRSVAAVMTRAARLGLPRRFAPGRKAGQRYDGMPTGTPARQKKSESRTSSRSIDPENMTIVAQTVERICLMCLKKFDSSGRHNRICPSCKGSPEYAAASRIPDITFGAGS